MKNFSYFRSVRYALILFCIISFANHSTAQTITTFAGGYLGDGDLATAIGLNIPIDVVADAYGNYYIAESNEPRVRKVNSSGIISTYAGNGTVGYSGDGGAATAAQFVSITGLALDNSGNLYVSDAESHTIRKVSTSGIITTIAGTGTAGYSGDGGPATAAAIAYPYGLCTNAGGDLFFADPNRHVVRKINTSGVITTFAGTGTSGFSGDGGAATAANMNFPVYLCVDASGNLYISDELDHRIRMVTPSGTISTFAGDGTMFYSSDGVPATSTSIGQPYGIIALASGDVVICDEANNIVRIVNSSGIVNTLAGNFYWGYGGDGGAATDAMIAFASGITVDPSGNLLIADSDNGRIRSINASGNINTIAGGYVGAGRAATTASFMFTDDVAIDGSGNFYVSCSFYHQVWKINSSGVLSLFAGNGSATYFGTGDGGAATAANMVAPMGIAADRYGNIYIADQNDNRIRKVDASGVITTIAGSGSAAYGGDGGAATAADIYNPAGVAVDTSGNVYIADTWNHVIRKINTSGIISTIAGNGTYGYSGDGGPATAAALSIPVRLSTDRLGNLYIADGDGRTIRKVDASGTITTFAGNGTAGYSGDGGAATAAELAYPSGVFAAADGSVYIADGANWNVRRVDPSGIITTIAGSPYTGFSGDGGPGTNARLSFPTGVCADPSGNVYIADKDNYRIRKISGCTTPAAGTISGSTTVCVGATVTLVSSGAGGGSWSSSAAGVATVNSSGAVTGMSAGTANITYTVTNSCGSAFTTSTIAVINTPSAGTISGPSSVCVGATISLSSSGASGGSWTSSASGIATVTSGGAVIGVSVGAATITYTVTNSCGSAYTTSTITVNPLPSAGTLSGPSTVCVGASISLSSSGATGGSWTSSSSAVATVNTSGAVTGVGVGTATITYTVTNSCGSVYATSNITVNPMPDAGAISGATTVCVGAALPLTSSGTSGGGWSSSAAATATVNSGGVVTGISVGAATISYSVTNSCGTADATYAVNVITTPYPGTISGATTVCIDSVITLTDTVTGGSWSSGTAAVATVNTTGQVSGVTAGTTTISYTLANSCGNASATYTITVIDCKAGVADLTRNINSPVLYPNPSRGSFTISFLTQTNGFSVSVTNLFGQCVGSFEAIPGKSHLDITLEPVATGMYFVRITNTQGDEFVYKISILK